MTNRFKFDIDILSPIRTFFKQSNSRMCPLDAYPIEQVDYFWKDKDNKGIVILEDEMNEFTLRDIKTRRAIVLYGTRGSSKYSHSVCSSSYAKKLMRKNMLTMKRIQFTWQ